MGDVHPNGIIIDQCESIRKALREVMPNTIHRFCIWHILAKLQKKIEGLVADYNRCTNEFKAIVYDNLDIQTFESKWASFLVKYGFENNEWLKELYRKRKSWVPVYLHHMFWAGMISTQRSESMHAYFDEFIHSRSTLKQFMEHYDMTYANKIQKEFQVEYDSKTRQIRCITTFAWEKQYQNVYTNSIFRLVQEQIQCMHCCFVVHPNDHDTNNLEYIEKFRILERSILNDYFRREFTYTVEWRLNGSYTSYNCRKFEFRGVL